MNRANPHKKRRNAVFDTMRLLEKGHIAFHILRNRHDALTFVAAVVGERIEIDVFEDDHVEISRFRGDESIKGGRELLLQIVTPELRENYPPELLDAAAK